MNFKKLFSRALGRTSGKVPGPDLELAEIDLAWRVALTGEEREVVAVSIGKMVGGERDGQLTMLLEMRGERPDIAMEMSPHETMLLGIAAIEMVAGPPEIVHLDPSDEQ